MKAPTSAAPVTSVPTISALVQPRLLARISAQTRPSTPPVASTRPSGSRRAGTRAPAVSLVRISGIRITPNGTFSQKIHCQAMPCATAPPTTGPPATPRPVTALKMPMAHARRCGGNPADSSANASGSTSAAPAPCTALAATSAPASGASAHAADAAVNSPSADGEHAAPSQPLAECRAGQQQHGEAQRVRVHRPLQRRERRVQVHPDHRQGRGHHLSVERHHERRHRRQRQHPALPGHQAPAFCSHVSSLLRCFVGDTDTGPGGSSAMTFRRGRCRYLCDHRRCA